MKRKAKTSPKDQAFMPLFFGDFLASTAEWDGEERSLYLLCLAHQWELGSLPAEPRKLRKLVDYEPDSFERWWPTVSAKFIDTGSGRIGNARLEEHRAKSIEISQSKASAGKAGAAARWGKDGNRIDNAKQMPSNADGAGTASAMRSHANGNGTAKATANGAATDPGCVRHDFGNGSIPSHPIPSQSDPDSHTDTSPHTHASQGLLAQPAGDANAAQASLIPEPEPPAEPPAEDDSPEPDEPPAFTAIRNAYPKREGSHRWRQALKHYRARLKEGFSAEQMRQGVERYAKHIRANDKERTKYVLQAATFLGTEKEFLHAWPLPKTGAEIRQDQNIEASQQWLAGQDLNDA